MSEPKLSSYHAKDFGEPVRPGMLASNVLRSSKSAFAIFQGEPSTQTIEQNFTIIL